MAEPFGFAPFTREVDLSPKAPEVRTYHPTWRERLAQTMMGDSQSQGRRDLVSGLTGSAGLGSGFGLLDMTPAGIPLAVQENLQGGKLRDAALAATPLGIASRGAKGIRAYHGSPHDFDRFSLEHIGKGEGAQSYGHGLYFAEAEPVAKSYRDALGGSTKVGGVNIFDDASWLTRFSKARVTAALEGATKSGLSGDEAIRAAVSKLTTDGNLAGRKDVRQQYYDAANAVGGLIGKKWEQSPGRMYEVNINTSPERMLDWDKPLSAQPHVADAMLDAFNNPRVERQRQAGWRLPSWGDGNPNASYREHIKGSTEYGALASNIGSWEKTSAALKERGIPGIRYLDQSSRNPGLSSLTPAQLDARIEGLRGDIAGGGGNQTRMAEQLAGLEREREAYRNLTHNYVVFDDSLIDIMRKYAIPGMVGGGAVFGSLAPGER